MKLILKPASQLGWWAVGLAIGYLILMPLWSFMGSLGAGPAFICGAAAGVAGLIAVIQKKEQSILVYLAILPLAFVLFFLLGEFLIPH